MPFCSSVKLKPSFHIHLIVWCVIFKLKKFNCQQYLFDYHNLIKRKQISIEISKFMKRDKILVKKLIKKFWDAILFYLWRQSKNITFIWFYMLLSSSKSSKNNLRRTCFIFAQLRICKFNEASRLIKRSIFEVISRKVVLLRYLFRANLQAKWQIT